MMTLRQIERLWQSRAYDRMVAELLPLRPEASKTLQPMLRSAPAAAALAMLRIDELGQGGSNLSQSLLREILIAQQPDGGWIDPVTTSLCLKALASSAGRGIVIDRGIKYLANLQKPEGVWPIEPLRRLPADAYVSAYVLFCVGELEAFQSAVRFDEAVMWMEAHEGEFDQDTRSLWNSANRRISLSRALLGRATVASWS